MSGSMNLTTVESSDIHVLKTKRGIWVTDAKYSEVSGVKRQTLSNWRHLDKVAGRTQPPPGFPMWRRFGTKAIRYWLPDALANGEEA
jgi:hypothetical protein